MKLKIYISKLNKQVDKVLKVKNRLDEKIDASRYPYHVGIYREYLLKQLILDLLKKDLRDISSQIGITSGFIWESENVYSRQVDIIVFSNPEKALLKYGDFSLVAPEEVIAAVEIKTDLEKTELYKALDNVKSIQEVIRKSNNSSPPFIGVLAYSFKTKTETILSNIKEYYDANLEQSYQDKRNCIIRNKPTEYDPEKSNKFVIDCLNLIHSYFPSAIGTLTDDYIYFGDNQSFIPIAVPSKKLESITGFQKFYIALLNKVDEKFEHKYSDKIPHNSYFNFTEGEAYRNDNPFGLDYEKQIEIRLK